MQKKIFYSETILVLLLLYFLFFFGFYFNEDANGGSINDWKYNKFLINSFLNDFQYTFLNYDQYSTRHSPVFLILLTFLYKLNLTETTVRFLNLNFSLISVLFFYKCLILKYKEIDKNYLYLISFIFLISPTFRSLSIWPGTRIFGFHFFIISTFFYLKFIYEEKKIIYCYLNIIFLAIASYCSVNFCLFAIYFFYKFFSYYKFSLNIFYLTILNVLLAFPAYYYLFILDIFYIFTAGPGDITNSFSDVKNIFYFNVADKILIIPTIIAFYFLPILIGKKKLFINKINIIEIIIVLFFVLILIQFFGYKTEFTGGGIILHISSIIFKNNYLFYLFSFLSLLLIYDLSKNNFNNLFLILILFFTNPQISVYHKYYDPLIIFFVFLLFEFEIKKSFFRYQNIIYIYMYYLAFLSISIFKTQIENFFI